MGTLDSENKITAGNSTYKKLAAQCLNEASCFEIANFL
jgi:hypothetical protein